MKDFPKTCQPTKLPRSGPIFVLDVFSIPPAGKIGPRLAFSRPDGVLEKPRESFRLDSESRHRVSFVVAEQVFDFGIKQCLVEGKGGLV